MLKECSVNECKRTDIRGHGFCAMHYARWYKYGSPSVCKRSCVWRPRGDGLSSKNPKEYSSYNNMKTRCFNKNHSQYGDYGGRGITVYDRWLGKDGFKNFLLDMGKRPDGASLDRIDVNGMYSPRNCRWATRIEQQNNMRTNHLITYDGETHTLTEWSRKKGLSMQVLYNRIMNYKWNIGDALNTPSIKKVRKRK